MCRCLKATVSFTAKIRLAVEIIEEFEKKIEGYVFV